MNMTKKGGYHLRTFFIHGVRAVVRVSTNNNDGSLHQWVNQLKERRGFNKTTVAVVDKNARVIWSMLRNDIEYQVVGILDENTLPPYQERLLIHLHAHYLYLVERITEIEAAPEQEVSRDETGQRLLTIPCIGSITVGILSSLSGD